MSANNTPQQIVERWLPNYKEVLENYIRTTLNEASVYQAHVANKFKLSYPETKRRLRHDLTMRFCDDHFVEALAERDRQMKEKTWTRACEKQRAAIAMAFDNMGALQTAILEFAMPKMDE